MIVGFWTPVRTIAAGTHERSQDQSALSTARLQSSKGSRCHWNLESGRLFSCNEASRCSIDPQSGRVDAAALRGSARLRAARSDQSQRTTFRLQKILQADFPDFAHRSASFALPVSRTGRLSGVREGDKISIPFSRESAIFR